MFQKWIGIGRLTKDPELRHTPDGTAVAKFTIAVDRRVSKEAKERGAATADFIDVVAWRQQAENLCKYRKKGDPVAIEGTLQIRSYNDKDGIRRKAAEIVASNIVYLPNGKKNSESDPWPSDAPPEYGRSTAASGGDDFSAMEEFPFSEDDMAF
jgi:single-strand DNA-binding protein